MSLKIIFFTLCFVPFFVFSMEDIKPRIQDVDHEWFLMKLVEYKIARQEKQWHDGVVARLQKKNQRYGNVSRNCNPKAKL